VSAGDLITGPGQLQWRNLLLGPGTDYDLKDLSGWEDMPPVDVGSKTKPRGHGADPGRMLAQPHVFTAVFDLNPLTAGGTGPARAFLRAQTGLPDDTRQEPVAVCLDQGITMLRFGQLTARKIPVVLNYETVIKDVALQWQCADPRLYSSTLTTLLGRLPVADPSSGTGAYPLSYGGTYSNLIQGAGPQSAVNHGNASTPPVYTITGGASGVTSPAITIIDASGTRQTTFNFTLAPGDSLVIDVLNRTVLLNGASRYGFSGGTPIESLTLAPGTSTISFNGTGDASALLTAAFYDAYI